MADTKRGRDEQAHEAERRQREREIEEALDRADESEPPREDAGEADQADATGREATERPDAPVCHRRDCEEPATFVVLERYLEETGHGAVEAEALLCREHTAEEGPANLDGVYDDYVFQVRPLPGTASDGAS
jgi:hypothetical protein